MLKHDMLLADFNAWVRSCTRVFSRTKSFLFLDQSLRDGFEGASTVESKQLKGKSLRMTLSWETLVGVGAFLRVC